MTEGETFSGNYVEDLKKMLSKSTDIIKAMRDTEYEGIHVLIRIEDMKEITDYCKELEIMDKIILHDESDKDRIIKEKTLVLYK